MQKETSKQHTQTNQFFKPQKQTNMKKVLNSNELAHVWASQSQNEGRAGSFYFRDKTIYSYGSHFPIATIAGNDVLFTMRSYSNSTAKHIGKAYRAVSHKNLIYCYDVPVNLKYATLEHENNLNRWKKEIQALFVELGNKRIRDINSRTNAINNHIEKLMAYCAYFKLKIKDKELKKLLKVATSPDFLAIARKESEKETKARQAKMVQAAKAYDVYLNLWRAYDNDGLQALPTKTKELCNYYANSSESFTRLRYNTGQNRVETSKGVEIPAEIAKRAYLALNGCLEGICKDLSIPVLSYTITETGKDYIKAGCHTIPKSDVWYIASLLNWK